MATSTIYTRVPETLKAKVDQYAADHGMSLASAVSLLLERGLNIGNIIPILEGRKEQIEKAIEMLKEL